MIRKVKVYFDGACEPAVGGDMAWAFIVYLDEKEVHRSADFMPANRGHSVAAAQFSAIHDALAYLAANGMSGDQVRFYGDDMNAVNLMNGRWKPKTGNAIPRYDSAKRLHDQFVDAHFTVVGRDENYQADRMVKDKFKENGVVIRSRVSDEQTKESLR